MSDFWTPVQGVKFQQRLAFGVNGHSAGAAGLAWVFVAAIGCQWWDRLGEVLLGAGESESKTTPEEPLCIAMFERTYSGFAKLTDSHE